MSKRPEHLPATPSPASTERGALLATDKQPKKPEGGFEKSIQQDSESGIALGEQPAQVEIDIGSRMADRK